MQTRTLTLSLLTLWLAACVAQPLPAIPSNLSPNEVQRLGDAWTATAQVQATEVAGSTATTQARNDGLTATVEFYQVAALAAEATNQAAQRTSTAQAEVDAATSTAHSANLQATSLEAAGRTTQVAAVTQAAGAQADAAIQRTETQANSETARLIVEALTLVVVTVLLLGGMMAIIIVRVRSDADMENKRLKNETEMLAMKVKAFSDALRETTAGPALIDERGQALLLAAPGPVALGDAQFLDQDSKPSDLPRVPFIINSKSGSSEVSPLSDKELKAQGEMLAWLNDSMAYHRAHGSKAASKEKQLLGYRYLAGWNGTKQARVRAYFGEALIGQPGEGTYARDGLTLGELAEKVRFGRLAPVMPLPGNKANEQDQVEQPEQAEKPEVLAS